MFVSELVVDQCPEIVLAPIFHSSSILDVCLNWNIHSNNFLFPLAGKSQEEKNKLIKKSGNKMMHYCLDVFQKLWQD